MRSASGVTTMMQRPVGVSASGAPGPELHADGAQVVAEHLAEVVVADLADVGGTAAERGDAAHRVGRRPAAHLDRTAERPVQVERPVGVDQGHRALDQVVPAMNSSSAWRDDVDERVADADDVVQRRLAGRRRWPVERTAGEARYATSANATPDSLAHGTLGRVTSLDHADRPAATTRTACPRSVTPHRYTLALEPDLAAATFVGTRRSSTSTSTSPSSSIVLNAIELDDQRGQASTATPVAVRAATSRPSG